MRTLGIIFGPILAVAAWLGQVTPDQAMYNYSTWYELITKVDAPTWMESTSADNWGSRIFGTLSIACFLWFFWPWITSTRTRFGLGGPQLRTDQAPTAKPGKDWNALSTRLNKLRSESSNAHLLFVEGKRPIVERIRSALDLAGWETSFVPSAFDQYPQGGVGRYYSGIEVKGHNRILAEAVADALLRAGLADVYTTVEPLKMSRENAKWNRLQHRITIMVGHDKVSREYRLR